MNTHPSSRKSVYIPFRKHDIIEMCLQDTVLAGEEDSFRALTHMMDNVIHFEFHRGMEALKDAYAVMDPDAPACPVENMRKEPEPRAFLELLRRLLEKANYERVTEKDLHKALKESALFKIRLQVDFDGFEEFQFFYRGESTRQETVPALMGLSSKNVSFTSYDRVVMYIRFKGNRSASKSKRTPASPGTALLKLFQNVPKADLEMLFPNTRVSMRMADKLLIGIPAVITGGFVLATKLGASLVVLGSLVGFWLGLSSQPVELNKTALIVILAGMVALVGYLWRQFSAFKNRKLRFLQTLIKHLYFKNLDNNAGVLHRIADDAEEEECKEAVLAYYFLLTADRPLSKQELAEKTEKWFASKWNCAVSFDVMDALGKLTGMELVTHEQGRYAAVPMKQAMSILDRHWDASLISI